MKLSPNDFFPTLKHNIDNGKLSDADFRQFVRNTIKDMEPKDSLMLFDAPATNSTGEYPRIEGDYDTLNWVSKQFKKAEQLEELKSRIRFLVA